MLSREWYLDVWNGLWRSIANFTTAEVLQAIRQVALPLSSATALAQVNWRLAVDNPRLKKSAGRGSSGRLLSLKATPHVGASLNSCRMLPVFSCATCMDGEWGLDGLDVFKVI